MVRPWKTFLFILLILPITIGCHDKKSENGKLPSDPNKWVCQDSLIPASQAEIDEWCEINLNDLGEPLPDSLRNPPPLSMLDEKNNYDLDLKTFMRDRLYDSGLGWKSDKTWRITGPYVGEIGDGQNLTTHNAVKIYYSPEVVEWLCNDRQGEIPNGAMIVKEIHLINNELDITLDDEGCMVINADVVALPSIFEPFGLIAIEALACGTPVIARNVGGFKQVVNNEIGFLIDPGDYTTLAKRVNTFIRDGFKENV